MGEDSKFDGPLIELWDEVSNPWPYKPKIERESVSRAKCCQFNRPIILSRRPSQKPEPINTVLSGRLRSKCKKVYFYGGSGDARPP
jgi:hypothetical protein